MLRKKQEEKVARLEKANRRKHNESMTYRQIGKAYQASLNAFKAKLMGQGLSDAEANAFRRQAVQN